jgi:hypothetical protein
MLVRITLNLKFLGRIIWVFLALLPITLSAQPSDQEAKHTKPSEQVKEPPQEVPLKKISRKKPASVKNRMKKIR